MQLSVITRTTVATIALFLILQYGGSPTLAGKVTADQLNEAQTFIRRELSKLDQEKNLSQQEIEVQRQKLQSKLTCVQGIVAQSSELQNQVICKQVLQEVADGKLERSAAEKAQDWMPMVIVGIVAAIFILSKIRM